MCETTMLADIESVAFEARSMAVERIAAGLQCPTGRTPGQGLMGKLNVFKASLEEDWA